MHRKARFQSSFFGMSFSPRSGPLATVLTLLFPIFLFSLLAFTPQPAQGQTYRIIYNFTGGLDGGQPYAGLTMDTAGNLYGTTWIGGYTGGACANSGGCGTVFNLSNRGSGWALRPLYAFQGSNDGAQPEARVVFGPGGSLYGTTADNYTNNGTGTVFNLRPPATACRTALCPWTETVLYGFSGGSDGASPGQGDVVFDRAGNLYGTTVFGGTGGCSYGYGCGVVFKLTLSSNGWTEDVLWRFSYGSDGFFPLNGVIFDQAGNLYGVASYGGDLSCDFYGYNGCGTVFQLTPSGSAWEENVLHTFHVSGGSFPQGGLLFDPSGNLYGTTSAWFTNDGGTVFQLTYSNGYWTFSTLHSFTGSIGPEASLSMDIAGALYGTTYMDGTYGYGNVFKLTHSGEGWTYTSLYDFRGGSDGGLPVSNVMFDANGNLYGTASGGGAHGYGVVWEITP